MVEKGKLLRFQANSETRLPRHGDIASPESIENSELTSFDPGTVHLVLASVHVSAYISMAPVLGKANRHIAHHNQPTLCAMPSCVRRDQPFVWEDIVIEQQHNAGTCHPHPSVKAGKVTPMRNANRPEAGLISGHLLEKLDRAVVTTVNHHDQLRSGLVSEDCLDESRETQPAIVARNDHGNLRQVTHG
jgi:hypothetical protein